MSDYDKQTEHYEDFVLRWWFTEWTHKVDFEIIDAVSIVVDGNNDDRWYKYAGDKEDWGGDINKAELLLVGELKWDGCLNIDNAVDCMMHFCGPEEDPLLGRAIKAVYALGPKIRNWDCGGGYKR